MKPIYIFIVLLLTILTISSKSYSQNEFPVLEGPYFGQKPPHLIPYVFAPGIISINERHEGAISFSPGLDELYFSVSRKGEDQLIYFSKVKNKKWTPIQQAKFTKETHEIQPFVSPDGKRLYFTAVNLDFTSDKIWYVNRLENSWGKAIKLELPINDDNVFYPNQANNGDLYYFNLSKRKSYYAPNVNGSFPKVKEVKIGFGVHAAISPSQDYIVVNARNKEDDSRTDSEIYVYFKKIDGTWTKPINLGDTVNSNFPERAPRITPDGKYLFFSRFNEEGGLSNLYWVSTKVIENVRPKL
jgi:Tol biopolymer transport system component